MIINIFKNENNQITLIFKGHAKSNIVCAAASTLLIASANCMLSFDQKSIDYKENKDTVTMTILTNNNIIITILKNMIEMFQEISIEFPNDIQEIKIKENVDIV